MILEETKKILEIIELKSNNIVNIEYLTIAYLYELELKNIDYIIFQIHFPNNKFVPSNYELLKYGFVYPSEEKNMFYDKQIYHFIHTDMEDIIILQKHEFIEYNVASIIRKLKIENLLED